MLGKRTRFVTMLAAALGIPYVWFNEDLSQSLSAKWKSVSARASAFSGRHSGSATDDYWPVAIQTDGDTLESINQQHPARLQPAIHSFQEVLRFDINARWVIDKWGRVSTVHAERDLEGLRVPLVTGTAYDDVAGSLTYYFDRYKRLRRISLHGQTGDDRALVEFVTKHFAMLPEPALGSGIYLRRWNAKPMNALRISHAPVIRSAAPARRFIVELELNDVTAGYGLSPEFQYLISLDQAI